MDLEHCLVLVRIWLCRSELGALSKSDLDLGLQVEGMVYDCTQDS